MDKSLLAFLYSHARYQGAVQPENSCLMQICRRLLSALGISVACIRGDASRRMTRLSKLVSCGSS